MRSAKSTQTIIDITDEKLDISDAITPLLEEALKHNDFEAGLFCCNSLSEENSFMVLCGITIPIEPFNGAANSTLNEFINECYTQYSAPHDHSIKDSELLKKVSSFCDTDNWFKRVCFIPLKSRNYHFVCFLFGSQDAVKKCSQDTINIVKVLALSATSYLNFDRIKKDHEVMESYVKEVGHDISSSVQAIIAKVRNVRRGLVTGRAAEKKLEEAEHEIMATHRVADTLGIAVDPDYNIRSGFDFNICQVIDSVIKLCASEAEERHCTINFSKQNTSEIVWGDSKAIESAITQYVINAIKYCHGGSTINIALKTKANLVDLSVRNIGIPVDEDIRQRMWNFGERGQRALEHHVNGSGIGLFTVNKIVKAHAGEVYFDTDRSNNGISIFGFRIPKTSILEKHKLL